MPPELLNNVIIAVAIIAAIVVIILLFKKIIKTVFALILIALIILGCYLGLQAIDNNTNLRAKLPAIDSAFTRLEEGNYDITSIQCNHLGNSIGVNVILQVDASSHELITELILEETRSILLDPSTFDDICSFHGESGYPVQLLVGIKYEGIEIQYYKASLKENPSGSPDDMYSDFEVVLDTGSIKDSLSLTVSD